MIFALYDGSSSIGRLGYFDETANGDYTPSVTLRRRLTPAAATKTYSLRAYVTGGTGFAAAGPGGSGVLVPGFILVRKPS